MQNMGDSTLLNYRPLFMQPLLPDYLDTFSIPKSFLKHLEDDLKGHHLKTVVLMTEHQPHRHWLVSVQEGRLFSHGWKDFCLQLHLQIGEFVVFTYHSHFLFHVSVFEPLSACERIFSSSHHLIPIPNTKAKGCQAIPSKKDPSSFVVKLTSYGVEKAIFFLPVGFVREHGLEFRRCEVMIIDTERRVWSVTLNYKKSDGQSYIKRGWKPFLAANCLEPGNVLCVQFLKGGSCPTLKCFRPSKIGEESNTTCKTTPEKAQVEDVTTSSSEQDQSQYLSCHVHLTSYSVKKSIIHLPARFVRESALEPRNCEVKVVDEEERTWKVRLSFKRSTFRAYICQGWRDVQTANCFRCGDVVCFQLLEAGERPVLKCYRTSRRKKIRFDKSRRCLVGAA